MTPSFYYASVPVYQRGLNGLLTILAKANDPTETGMEAPDLLGRTVAERLNPVSGQVVSACNRAGNDMRKALGHEVVKKPPPEPTYEAMKGRVDETKAFLDALPLDEVEQAAAREITLGSAAKGNLRTLSIPDYIIARSIPQFFFHLTTAYVTLRHAGLSLRKPDFLGHL